MRHVRLVILLASMAAGTIGAVPQEQVRELETSVRDGFTIASVGDLILAYPQNDNQDPGFRAVVKILQDADVTAGNYEGNIIDGRKFQGSVPRRLRREFPRSPPT